MTHSDNPPERRRADGRSTRLAASALRLLLDHPLLDLDELDWADMTRLAESAARGCARTQQAVALIDQLSNACKRLGLAHAFLKTVERYPDSGPDIDLLIAAASPALDAAILEHLPAIPCRRPLRHRLSGSRTYRAAFGLVIDVHHGRLGVFGEQARYARIVLSRARPAALGATMCLAPSPEDNLLLIATQQAYTRPALRIANVYAAITALQRPERLNWDYVFATALSTGTLPAVDAYLSYIERLHTHLMNRPLLPADILARFRVRERAAAEPDDNARFPRAGIARRLYLDHLYASMEAGRWHSMARLLLLPVMAALAAKSRRTT